MRLVGLLLCLLVIAFGFGCAEGAATNPELNRDRSIDPVVDPDASGEDAASGVDGDPDAGFGDAAPNGPDAALPEDAGLDAAGPDRALPTDGSVDAAPAPRIDAAAPADASVVPADASVVPDSAVADAQVTPDAAEPDAAPSCPAGMTLCEGGCFSLATDPDHCGDCEHACEEGQTCSNRMCQSPPPPPPPPPPQGCTAGSHGGHDYLFCNEPLRDWPAAREACQSYGMDLVIVDSASENDFLKGRGEQWIGANDRETAAGGTGEEGTWRWIQPGQASARGTALGYTAWNEGEPNNGVFLGEEDCAVITDAGGWNDIPCEVPRTRAFICESY